ncbi:MAG: exopolysaccharide biosynthesis polyprenyl glycosylphosphotransferase [Peptococcaceae bacterium]|nr:exopolysaccharide biosynthesis polyprenyl glycosylphosphotransferase [Peptococcaceae bacterium]
MQRSSESVLVVPDLFGLPVFGMEAKYFLNDQTLLLEIGNKLTSKWNILVKRVFDIIVGLIIFLFILPVLAIFSILIKLDSRGPVLFVQKRLGRNGKIFNCLKFRTMLHNAEEVLKQSLEQDPELKKEWEENFKLKRDPRITRMGNFLRKTSLDELPQIINVLRGEMSLVGPRPRPLYELVGHNDPLFSVGLSVRPGMTGLWQVSGRNELDFKQRIKLDAVYVRNWSVWLDISLLFRTVSVVLWQKGAY